MSNKKYPIFKAQIPSFPFYARLATLTEEGKRSTIQINVGANPCSLDIPCWILDIHQILDAIATDATINYVKKSCLNSYK